MVLPTRSPTLSLVFKRTIVRQALKYRRPRPGTSERPPPKWEDPLAGSDRAVVTPLEDNLTFIHRPPPTAPTPFSLTTNPTSPLLRPFVTPPTAGPDEIPVSLPPLVRKAHAQPERVSEDVIRRIQFLREKDPTVYTRGVLAKRFGVTQGFVGQVAALKKPERKKRVAARDEAHEKKRDQWSDKHSLVKAIRKKRRELW
ncbi:mitochondrial ribosomal protein subunit L20-domain-containing protein [Flagelloscypha sp. PMI_526]|nr:mitochondrial ribosomal protein subunit L20-domain-containing protein [Flagelloscypha sp. PMI_526]